MPSCQICRSQVPRRTKILKAAYQKPNKNSSMKKIIEDQEQFLMAWKACASTTSALSSAPSTKTIHCINLKMSQDTK